MGKIVLVVHKLMSGSNGLKMYGSVLEALREQEDMWPAKIIKILNWCMLLCMKTVKQASQMI